MNERQAVPDTGKIDFRVRVVRTEYGDRRSFYEYRIYFCRGRKIVGVEDGPRRSTALRVSALRAARARVGELKRHRLFIIQVTRQDIRHGEARSCDACAIAQALWRNQERMGFDRRDFSFSVSPYAFLRTARGIVIEPTRGYTTALQLPADQLPKMSYGSPREQNPYPQDMEEWARMFDDWRESRVEGVAHWCERTGEERPLHPGTVSFVLDLDAFRQEVSG